MRFHYFSIVDDLSQALDFRQEALKLCPAGHLKRSSYTFDLASVMLTVYTWLFRDPEHLEAAILNHTLALSLRPEGHSDRAVSLQGLAATYSARFKHFWKLRIARFVKRHPSAERPVILPALTIWHSI
jgi:hypothetical protein